MRSLRFSCSRREKRRTVEGGATLSDEANIAAVRRYFRSFETGDLAELAAVVAPDVIDHSAYAGQPTGIDGYREFYRVWRTAFPDLRASVDDLLADGDVVVVRWTLRGTQQGDFQGHP